MLSLQSQLRIPPHVTASRIDEDTVLLDTRTNQYFALENVSSRLWSLLKDGRGLADICGILEKEYRVECNELERDVLELVQKLLENGLVELVEG